MDQIEKSQQEKEKITEEIINKWFKERKEEKEIKELSFEQEKEKLKREIEKIELSPQKEIEVQKEIEFLRMKSVEGKIRHLLDLAQSKGVAFAVKVAKETKNALIIDLFHDILAKDELFKKFPK